MQELVPPVLGGNLLVRPMAHALKSMTRANSGLTWIRWPHVSSLLPALEFPSLPVKEDEREQAALLLGRAAAEIALVLQSRCGRGRVARDAPAGQ
jgi:hypothetical protein